MVMPGWAASSSKRSRMRAMAQNRLTAVGRVRGQHVADGAEFFPQGGQGRGLAGVDAQRHAHGGAYADGRGSADNHGGDDVGHLLVSGGKHVGFFKGQPRLVEEADAFRGPFKSGDHRSFSVSCATVNGRRGDSGWGRLGVR